MSKIKTLLAVASAVILAIVMSGCGDSDSKKAQPEIEIKRHVDTAVKIFELVAKGDVEGLKPLVPYDTTNGREYFYRYYEIAHNTIQECGGVTKFEPVYMDGFCKDTGGCRVLMKADLGDGRLAEITVSLQEKNGVVQGEPFRMVLIRFIPRINR